MLQAHRLGERGNAAANPHYDHPPVQAPELPSVLQADERAAAHLPFQDRYQGRGRLVQRDLPANRFL